MSYGIRMDYRDARRQADNFINLFRCGVHYERWQIAGSIRLERTDVGDIDHVIIPKFKQAPREGLFEDDKKINLVWERAEELVRDGVIVKHLYGTGGFRWGEKQRGVDFKNIKHDLYTTTAFSWGAALTIRTGPWQLSRFMVTRLLSRGMRADQGKVWHCVPCPDCVPDVKCETCKGTKLKCERPIEVPDEETFFSLCGITYREPWKRVVK
jgi:DNA polymerase/3'-5' exonuclease PolX